MHEAKLTADPAQSRFASAFDRAIFALFPKWGAGRMAVRNAWQFAQSARERYQRAWEAADIDRVRGHRWMVSRLSPDSALEEDLQTLRERARDLARNDPFACGAIDNLVCNVVGQGIRPQGRIAALDGVITERQAEQYNDELEGVFRDWAPRASSDGLHSFWDIQRQLIRCMADSDAFTVLSDVGAADKPIPLAVEVIDPMRVGTPPGKESERVRLGIEYDDQGRRVAYWVCKSHPGDSRATDLSYERIEAARMQHLYEQLWPGQSRGVPWLAPVMANLKDLKDYREAEVIGAQTAACYAAFITTANPQAAGLAAASDTTASGKRVQEISPGMIEYLSPGSSVTIASPNRPGGGYAPFVDANLKAIAAGLNYPYELLVKNYQGTTYSSGRLSLIDGRLMFSAKQAMLGERVLAPIWCRLVEEAVIVGATSINPRVFNAHRAAFLRHAWIAPGWSWIDPTKEIAASRDAVDANLSTLTEELAGRGLDLEETLRTRQREQRLLERYGVKPPPRIGAAPAAVDERPTGEDSSGDKPSAPAPEPEQEAATP